MALVQPSGTVLFKAHALVERKGLERTVPMYNFICVFLT